MKRPIKRSKYAALLDSLAEPTAEDIARARAKDIRAIFADAEHPANRKGFKAWRAV